MTSHAAADEEGVFLDCRQGLFQASAKAGILAQATKIIHTLQEFCWHNRLPLGAPHEALWLQHFPVPWLVQITVRLSSPPVHKVRPPVQGAPHSEPYSLCTGTANVDDRDVGTDGMKTCAELSGPKLLVLCCEGLILPDRQISDWKSTWWLYMRPFSRYRGTCMPGSWGLQQMHGSSMPCVWAHCQMMTLWPLVSVATCW